MVSAHEFLTALTIVLGAAGLTTIVFQRLKQPVVLGYIVAGLAIGPHVPMPVVANPDVVHTLSELGVIMLMFGLGLEFTLAKLFRAAPTAGITAVLQCSLMLWLGYLGARLLGWTSMESLYAGAVISISSTTIIAKAFEEQGVGGHLREFVVAVLIVEDLVAVLLLAILTSMSSGDGVSAIKIGETGIRLAGVLAALIAIGLVIVPRVMRGVARLERAETTTIAAIAICFGVALLVHALGYSVALGAFVAGMLVAESGKASHIAPLVQPVRDVFAAVFFVSVGMLIDPWQIVQHWAAILVLTLLVVGGKITSVSLGAFMTGKGTRTSVAAGLSLAQIGEFSFIIAGLGLSLGVIGAHVYPVAVAVSAITTLLTPSLIRRSDWLSSVVDRNLPKRLQTFVALYGTWLDRVRTSPLESRAALRRFARTLLIDVVAIMGGLIAVSMMFDALVAMLIDIIGIERPVARVVVVIVGGALVLPFCVSILLTTQRFAHLLGELAMPRQIGDAADPGRPARIVLESAVRLIGIVIVGTALIATTQPFLPGYTAAIALLVAITVLAILFWRTAANLQGHVRAAAQALIEVLASEASERAQGRAEEDGAASRAEEDAFARAHALYPGVGAPARVVIPADGAAAGRSLAELDLRTLTGATVIAVVRDGAGTAVPDSRAPLGAGDVLAIAGSEEAIAAAAVLLTQPRAGRTDPLHPVPPVHSSDPAAHADSR